MLVVNERWRTLLTGVLQAMYGDLHKASMCLLKCGATGLAERNRGFQATGVCRRGRVLLSSLLIACSPGQLEKQSCLVYGGFVDLAAGLTAQCWQATAQKCLPTIFATKASLTDSSAYTSMSGLWAVK